MIALVLALTLLEASAPVQAVQPAGEIPAACRQNPATGRVDHRACAAATPRDSGYRSLAAINLGTEAYLRGDATEALRWYDEAEIPGQRLQSDAVFHAFRADARRQGGRAGGALEDARLAWTLLKDPTGGPALEGGAPPDDAMRFGLLSLILPILKTGGDEAALAEAKAAYIALPVEGWAAHANRAGVLETIDDFPAALIESGRALELAPEQPMVLNNHCYTLTRAGRGIEGIDYCRRAIALLTDEPAGAKAAVRHSYASALASAGRCDEARAQLAEAKRLTPANPLYDETLTCAVGG